MLLPSLGRDSEEFDPIAAEVAAAGFRVVRPRPRGFGRSVGQMERITLHDFARDVAAAIEHQNAGPAIVVGHAYGHLVARTTATDFPKLVRAVVLLGASQKVLNPEHRRWLRIAVDASQPESERLKYLQMMFFAPGHDPRAWLTGFDPVVLRSQFAASDGTPQREYLVCGNRPSSRSPGGKRSVATPFDRERARSGIRRRPRLCRRHPSRLSRADRGTTGTDCGGHRGVRATLAEAMRDRLKSLADCRACDALLLAFATVTAAAGCMVPALAGTRSRLFYLPHALAAIALEIQEVRGTNRDANGIWRRLAETTGGIWQTATRATIPPKTFDWLDPLLSSVGGFAHPPDLSAPARQRLR